MNAEWNFWSLRVFDIYLIVNLYLPKLDQQLIVQIIRFIALTLLTSDFIICFLTKVQK